MMITASAIAHNLRGCPLSRATERGKGLVFVALCSLVWSACAATQPLPPGRVGEVRGKVVRVEREQELIAVKSDPDGAEQWFQLKPFTGVSGDDISRVGALKIGERVYVRYLREPRTEPPEVLSITVLRYTLRPSAEGLGTLGVPGL
jgi:hypothetical protein